MILMSTKLVTAAVPKVHREFPPPRAAYIHVPFCRHRCGYCNFTLITGRDDLIGDYLRAIEIELASLHTPREVDTLYFGGGTPTHLDVEQFKQLAITVLHWHPLAVGYEWTVEANPADIDEPKIETLAALGVTRLSLGSQSFRHEKLRILERDHAPADIQRSVAFARRACMLISLDLIFAAPGETLDQWSADLDKAVALSPDHVSTYGLTFEQGTEFWNRRHRGELTQADESLELDMYALAIDRLTDAGFEHYEVSNFARPGYRSRHNETYWSGAGYYAAGPGAARYVNGARETNHRSTTTYIKRVVAGDSAVAERERLSPEARARELLVFSLRRLEGVSRHEFRQRTGCEIDELIAAPLKKLIDHGLLADEDGRIQLTRQGLFVSDAIWPEFL
jgi:oxygen-independent coproporphyrinogen-3 oxidase